MPWSSSSKKIEALWSYFDGYSDAFMDGVQASKIITEKVKAGDCGFDSQEKHRRRKEIL